MIFDQGTKEFEAVESFKKFANQCDLHAIFYLPVEFRGNARLYSYLSGLISGYSRRKFAKNFQQNRDSLSTEFCLKITCISVSEAALKEKYGNHGEIRKTKVAKADSPNVVYLKQLLSTVPVGGSFEVPKSVGLKKIQIYGHFSSFVVNERKQYKITEDANNFYVERREDKAYDVADPVGMEGS